MEEPTSDQHIGRRRQVKNCLAITLLSQGTRMLLMGDKVRRTQGRAGTMRRTRPRAGIAVAGLITIVALSGALGAAAAEPPPRPAPAPPPPAAPAAPPVVPIPVPEIAQRAEEMAAVLQNDSARLAADARVTDVESLLDDAADWISARLLETTDTLDASPSPGALATLTDAWVLMRHRLVAWNETLTRRALELERDLTQLDAQRATWSATAVEARASGAPPPVLARIDATLAAIVKARNAVGEQRARVLRLQDRGVKETARCDAVLARIGQVREDLVGSVLIRDSAAIWSREARTLARSDIGPRLRRSLGDAVQLTRDYVAGQLMRVPLQVGLFIVVLMLARRARTRGHERAAEDADEAATAEIFAAPLSSALALALLATESIYPHVPHTVMNAVGLVILPPVVLIVRRLVPVRFTPAVYALAAFFVIDRVRDVCAVFPRLEQWVFLVEMIFGVTFLAFAVRSEPFAAASGWARLLTSIVRGQLGVLGIAGIAAALGYMRLARLLATVVVASNYAGLVLYAGTRIGEGLLAYLLTARPLTLLRMVQHHRALLRRRAQGVLRWLAVGAWIYITLSALGMAEPVASAIVNALDARYVRGSIDVSVTDVLLVGVTIVIAFLVSGLVRFVLQEDIYPRVGLPRGPAYALSTLLHYAVILAGFLLAVSALGVDLTRVTILAGALGVGIGIGFQNVVANFVSGLVLLLEHRIHVGDSIETADLQGEVREIGFRASLIRTWAGAEVIVPNSRLASERVTNWTLSDRRSRVTVSVMVAFTSSPPHVLDVLRKTGETHPTVLRAPAPLALCTGFSETGLRFELRVWTARFEEAEILRSDLTMAIHAALAAERIMIAVPQQEVHVREPGEQR
jgi:small-conductance mechanosensitive channel